MVARGQAREAELAARWSAGCWRGATLRTERGEAYRVVFEGRRGGGAGPDFRDAVLARDDGSQVFGDIELHLRPTGWRAHGHAHDPRYDGLALHIVVTRSVNDPTETTLASGRAVPLVVLGRLDNLDDMAPRTAMDVYPRWPCAAPRDDERDARLRELLHEAGMARFAEHTAQFVAALRAAPSSQGGDWDAPNRILWRALAEALGYGRDRAALQRLGESLLAASPISTAEMALSGVERMRVRGLLAWHARWRRTGPWPALAAALNIGDVRQGVIAVRAALRVDERGAVSPGRANIVAVNVALPFAAALAASRQDEALANRARAVYEAWPGLPSNQIVREMARTLGLARLPRGALAQQGLHNLWRYTCREKQCARCPCNCSNLLH
jgi:uncharacterized protein DUF2851